MEQTRDEVERMKSQAKNPVGAARDMQNLSENTSASVDELREFVAGLKGRSPQEVLGIVTQNSLFQGVVQATVGCVVVLAVLTVGPWMLADEKPAGAEDLEIIAASTSADAASAEEAAPAETEVAAADVAGSADTADPASAAAAMGIDEVKDADAESNPLDTDSKLDSLLDGL